MTQIIWSCGEPTGAGQPVARNFTGISLDGGTPAAYAISGFVSLPLSCQPRCLSLGGEGSYACGYILRDIQPQAGCA